MRMYTAQQIADFFLAITEPDDNDVSNLKLQKLCYYAQGLCSVMRGSRLINDRFEAWDHGPVIPALYRAFKQHGREPIPPINNFDFDQIGEADRRALTDIYSFYGQYSAWRLRNMTHEEKPWVDAYKRPNKEISLKELDDFFRPQVDESYMKDLYGTEAVH